MIVDGKNFTVDSQGTWAALGGLVVTEYWLSGARGAQYILRIFPSKAEIIRLGGMSARWTKVTSYTKEV